jgi:hypothetical protein
MRVHALDCDLGVDCRCEPVVVRRRRTYTSKDVRSMAPKRKPLERAGKQDRFARPPRRTRKTSR